MIGQKVALAYGCFKNTATARPSTISVVSYDWKTTLVVSRFTYAAEKRYTPVESEIVAVAEALDNTWFFIHGCINDLVVGIDRKLLFKLFGDRSLDEIPDVHLEEGTL